MQEFIIGIDTGGTFTDAALVNIQTREVVTTSKKATTHYNLAVGINEALHDLFTSSRVLPEKIARVAVSSTLATNSVVENRGARVAVITIGYVRHFKLPVKAVIFVKGGHTILGEEENPLDIDYLVQIISGLKNEVDAYGICSAMSMKNPTHELVAEKAITMIDPKPVFCSHRISQQAGIEERAATAALHAKLMPIMEDFVHGVQHAMEQCSLSCPLYVIGGNATSLDTEKVVSEAALTVASGPACTATFGGAHSDMKNCLVLDIGGTTTDIAMIRDGKPLFTENGCHIGDWKTRVEAVDMRTGGIGGDSLVQLDHRKTLSIGPTRVTPLATCGDIPAVDEWFGQDSCSRLIVLNADAHDLDENDLNNLLKKRGMVTPDIVRKETGLGGIPLEKKLEHLRRKQQIVEYGFTPTDALHVLGIAHFGNADRAIAAATILGNILGMDAQSFSQRVVSEVEVKIETLVLDYIANLHWGNTLTSFLSSRNDHPILGVRFSLRLPIVGVGAAAQYFLPGVARKLATTVSFPLYGEVGNALGAAQIVMDSRK